MTGIVFCSDADKYTGSSSTKLFLTYPCAIEQKLIQGTNFCSSKVVYFNVMMQLYNDTPHRANVYNITPYRAKVYNGTPYRVKLYNVTPYRAKVYNGTPYRAKVYNGTP